MEALLSTGEQSATVPHLLKAKSTIVSYILDGSVTEQKLHFYDRAISKIDEYLATRHLRLYEERLVSRQGYDKKLWHDEKIMAFYLYNKGILHLNKYKL
ncbi:MAG: hypothetical protein ACFFG0_52360 [Candidatus Thorarchaeota archaeon]